MPRLETGWTWFDPAARPTEDESGLTLARQTARLFATADGEAVLAHLREMTLDRCLGPDSGDAALRHLEGQRHLVLHLQTLVARGRTGI
ncbi:hypothetical protein CU669_01640 [Paramagnetospirillum kuznetsovii]|uniref:Bbp19-like phage domain-containing protein n=1 Tax=Paramagnetospirillum kuznetsovii TaxID=2053833 RepID=A0A364P392_9PROT|nr:hypothetical protein [Paramagnetospirillum kuznetsovii]RAU23818.1 hypothetical protein CU669_01640 [Paramagnetospirillum kuznetsovii]